MENYKVKYIFKRKISLFIIFGFVEKIIRLNFLIVIEILNVF